TLRHYEKGDKERLIELLNDKEVSKWTERIPFPYLEKHADWWINNRPVNEYIYAIIKKDVDCLIGGTNITTKGEIGCWIGRRYWNQGFATETIERMKKYGFEELQLGKVWAATHKENKTVFRLMEKTGFSRVKDRPYYVEGIGDTKIRPHFELTK
ncbi:MAG: hypothetical protein CL886_06130, partial [Dehalococcoidia bacterium]|nr:hypothetical protein [Dehalococcoidia bacterium]